MTRPGTRRAVRPDRADRGERPARPPLPDVYRRRRRLAGVLVGAVVLVGLGLTARLLLYDAGLADVDQVEVVLTTPAGTPVGGAGPDAPMLSEQQVLAAAGVEPGGPLIEVDVDAVAARVAALPAVASVEVRRDWPHTVSVRVVQRTPIAVVRTGGGPALVDGTGSVFPGPPVVGLPDLAVSAPGPADPATLAAVGVLAALPGDVRVDVLTVTGSVDPAGGPAQVALGLTDQREVSWGSAERSADKAAVLGPLLTQPGRLYDVTSPDLPTIER
ncbi:cell division protein FtsQ/DivIB [Pseudonocardia humida]|uniref:FtsQ-type POTRA domain-containing protein n=1 Tax=Pseudonocardia humida TaxID=2800819 RepID=A0ABT0ZYZ0_9PSEU|nr:FtsQ-type POTRA domain-containing protein [Pseudonocardia humida]MCO1655895.1 FtsQ-type POTRA domain-containing protein [Pseudonocardia humida]